ncbi:MAG: TonB family protein [Pyrinomonadaceae bacterium]|nr:TonB family protein [Pyrinomonadaceae bacterium]
MPLNVRRFYTSVLLILTFSIFSIAQTSADVMRERVAKAKAFIAVRNYSAAIYELENIRRETSEPTVQGVINVLLINSFLEQGDYKRAQDFLTELSKKPGASANYLSAAGQVVKGARNQMERYRSLGLSVSDRNLPKEAVADVDKMRETLEKVVEQTKVLSKDKAQTSNAMALMEEATNVRGNLARDTYDANRWKNETADAREDLANSRSVVVNAVTETPTQTIPTMQPTQTNIAAANDAPQPTINPLQMPVMLPVSAGKTNVAENIQAEKPPIVETPLETKKTDESSTVTENSNKPIVAVPTNLPKDDSPLAVGSLVTYATQKSTPIYPLMAKNMRMSGVVKVDLVVDEKGQVVEVQNTSGPAMLQRAAADAVKKWKFKPFTRGGQATKAIGFVNFNFSL